MVLECRLGYFTPIEVCYLLAKFGKTGKLQFDSGGEVYFLEGNVVHARKGKLMGTEALYQLSLEDDGIVRFFADEKPQEITISEESGILFEEIEKRKVEIKEFENKLPPFDTVPLKSTRTPEGEKIALRKSDWKILILVDGKNTLKDIVEKSGVGALEAYKTLHWLFEKGLIYDPTEHQRVLEEGKAKLSSILKSLGDGPWKDEVKGLIKRYGFEGALEVNEKIKVSEELKTSPENLREFFEEAIEKVKKKAEEVLGKVLARKKIQTALKEVKSR